MLMLMKVKTAMLAGAVAAPVLTAALAPAPSLDPDGVLRLAPAAFTYPAAGEFSRAGTPVDGPRRVVRLVGDLVMMKRQVTAAEYGRCVAEGACPRVPGAGEDPRMPVVGVSWHDASAYAAWLTRKTGMLHRLPTDEEWTFAAAEKARVEALPLVDPADPAQAWLARYEAESERARPEAKTPRPGGAFGTNSNGIDDLAGNVWEWTDSCFVRVALNGTKETVTNVNCGVRVVEGAHRTYMTDFIRDPKSGGCAQGVPPSNLGFRLVIEPTRSAISNIARNVTRLLGPT